MKNIFLATILSSVFFQSSLHAEDRVDLEGTSIIGNRELPKVLYIVPWKKPEIGDLNRPLNSIVDEIMAPLDRDVFSRQVYYHELITQGQDGQNQ